MSHVSVFGTKICNPNPQLVRQVMQALAQQHGAQLVEGQYRDIYGTVKADYILVVRGRGIGVRITNGLEIVGDPYRWSEMFNALSQQIVQTYVHFALLQQLQNMGYQIQTVQQLENGAIFGEVMKV